MSAFARKFHRRAGRIKFQNLLFVSFATRKYGEGGREIRRSTKDGVRIGYVRSAKTIAIKI